MKKQMINASVVIPAYKRIEQTVKTINLILNSNGLGNQFELEIIVSDSTPANDLEKAIKETFVDKVKYTRPSNPGVASNKNQGAKLASHEILIFCDSDMEVEKDTFLNTLNSLKNYQTAAAIGGKVIWRSGDKDGQIDRPRPENRIIDINNTSYIESLYSRFLATYKSVFWKVGGYDEAVFNMRGEGSDLSIRYWRAGYPLVYDSSIIVHHVHDAPDSVALRINHPEWGIAKDFVLLLYKYDMLDKNYSNVSSTVYADFGQFGKDSGYRIIQGITANLEFISQATNIIKKQKEQIKSVYNFKFLEVFSDREMLMECINKSRDGLNFSHQLF